MNQRLHVQHVLLSLRPGGLENGVVNVINGLDEGRFRSSVTCLQEGGEFVARIRRTKTDIVHTRNAEAFFYGFAAAKLARVRALVHSEHGRELPDSPRRMALL